MTALHPGARRPALALTFVVGASALILAQLAIRPWIGAVDAPDLLALGMAADLVIGLPALYYLLLVRPGRMRSVTLVPVAVAAYLIAYWMLPASHQGALEGLRWMAAPLELGLLGWVAYQARRGWLAMRQVRGQREADIPEALMAAGERVLPAPASRIFAYEAAILYYALLAWRQRTPEADPQRRFSVHRKSGYGALVAGLMIAIVVELTAIHVLLTVYWSPTAAWVATALSAYGALWILGDFQALRRRPTLLEKDCLELRVGLRWQATVPYEAIEDLRRLSFRDAGVKDRSPQLLTAVATGHPGFELLLRRPVTAFGPYGFQRRVRRLRFSVDRDHDFESRVSELRRTAPGAPSSC